MAIKTQFDNNVNTIGVNTQGAQEAQRGMQRNEANSWDFGKNLREGLQLATDINNTNKREANEDKRVAAAKLAAQNRVSNAQKTVDANAAKTDVLKIRMSEGYVAADDTLKEEIWNEQLKFEGRSKAYQDAFISYAASPYQKAAKGRITEENNSLYNSAPAAYQAWKASPSGAPDGSTNEQAGYGPTKFVDAYAAENPRLSKAVIGRSVLAEEYAMVSLDVQAAPDTPEGLAEATAGLAELEEEFKDNMFLNRNDEEGKIYLKSLKNVIGGVIAQKKKDIVLATSNELENNPYMTDEEVAGKARIIAYNDKSQELDMAKYNKTISDYQKVRTNLEMNNLYDADYVPTVRPQSELLTNPEVKKKHQRNTTNNLTDSLLSGDEVTFKGIVTANPDYLQEAHTSYMSTLFSEGVDTEAQDQYWSKTKDMITSEGGYSAMKSILGPDMPRVSGVILLKDYLGLDLATANDRINKYLDNPEDTKLSKDGFKRLAKTKEDLGPLQNEYTTLVMMAVAGGVDSDTAMDAVDKLFEDRIGDVGNTPSYQLAGTKTTVSPNAQDTYDNFVEKQAGEAKALNGGNPIYLVGLDNGKSVAYDATWGYKLPGYIDHTAIAKQSEYVAVLTGPTDAQKLGASVEGAAANSLNRFTSKYKAMGTIVDEYATKAVNAVSEALITDGYKKGTENLQNWREIQSPTSKVVVDEGTHNVLGAETIKPASFDDETMAIIDEFGFDVSDLEATNNYYKEKMREENGGIGSYEDVLATEEIIDEQLKATPEVKEAADNVLNKGDFISSQVTIDQENLNEFAAMNGYLPIKVDGDNGGNTKWMAKLFKDGYEFARDTQKYRDKYDFDYSETETPIITDKIGKVAENVTKTMEQLGYGRPQIISGFRVDFTPTWKRMRDDMAKVAKDPNASIMYSEAYRKKFIEYNNAKTTKERNIIRRWLEKRYTKYSAHNKGSAMDFTTVGMSYAEKVDLRNILRAKYRTSRIIIETGNAMHIEFPS